MICIERNVISPFIIGANFGTLFSLNVVDGHHVSAVEKLSSGFADESEISFASVLTFQL
jgi:hypothetical protein